jgi:hypothetical protein
MIHGVSKLLMKALSVAEDEAERQKIIQCYYFLLADTQYKVDSMIILMKAARKCEVTPRK